MTENNEAIKVFNEPTKHIKKILLDGEEQICYSSDMVKAFETAIKALEESQELHAIGTIEEFKALKEDGRFLEFLYNHILPNEMEQYLSMYRMKDKVAVNGYADQSGLMPAT